MCAKRRAAAAERINTMGMMNTNAGRRHEQF
jgi:hypothetical protein